MTTSGFILLDVAVAVFGIILVKKIFTKRSGPLPPGPPKLPILQNLLDMPNSQEWLTFAEWGKKWGMRLDSIFHFDLLIGLCSRRHSVCLNIWSANDHCKLEANSNGHDGHKERNIL